MHEIMNRGVVTENPSLGGLAIHRDEFLRVRREMNIIFLPSLFWELSYLFVDWQISGGFWQPILISILLSN